MIRTMSIAVALLATSLSVAHAAVPASIAAAVADPARPEEDKARDADRKPAEMLAFAGVKPGMTVVDVLPGGGYFTRLFAKAVGTKGKVIAFVPDEMAKNPKALERLNGLAAIGPNVLPAHASIMKAERANIADVVWTSQNYHDVHNLPGIDMVAFNRVVFQTVKPGGVYVVLDHAAAAGSGARDTNTTHRIDPALVKQEVTAAGFVFDGESKVLANPADDHMLGVFDKGLRGHTDQFVYRFRKPKK
jgi:predicted methyltransferase